MTDMYGFKEPAFQTVGGMPSVRPVSPDGVEAVRYVAAEQTAKSGHTHKTDCASGTAASVIVGTAIITFSVAVKRTFVFGLVIILRQHIRHLTCV